MKTRGTAEFVSAQKSEASGDFPASWWTTLLDEEGGAGEWYTDASCFASAADLPERLGVVEVVFEMRKDGRKTKVKLVSCKALAVAAKR